MKFEIGGNMRSRLFLFVLTFVLGVTLEARAQDPTLITVDFPNAGLPYITEAIGINSQGDVVGIYVTGGVYGTVHGFLRSAVDGSYTSIDFPGALSTSAAGINSRGDIVGTYSTNVFTSHGFVRSGATGEFTTIDFPGTGELNTYTSVSGINDRRDLVGRWIGPICCGIHSWLKRGDDFISFDFPGAIETDATGVNSSGNVVGSYVDRDAAGNVSFHGFIWSDGVISSVPDFPDSFLISAASGINSRGDIVGYYLANPPTSAFEHGYLLSHGVFTRIDFPGAFYLTSISGINSCGDIVGRYVTNDGYQEHGFLIHMGGCDSER
jgi:uncharacterized membrane protein